MSNLSIVLGSAILGAAASYALTPNAVTLGFMQFVASAGFVIWSAREITELIVRDR